MAKRPAFRLNRLIAQLMELETALKNPDKAAARTLLLATLKAAHDARALLSAKRPKRP